MQPLFHIARRAGWERAQRDGAYTVSSRGRTPGEEGFPHLYGPITPDAVVTARPWPPS